MVRRRKTLEEDYKPYLCRLMGFVDDVDGLDYPRTREWTQDELLAITPDNIARFFKKMAYGTPTPSPSDMPTHCRSSTLEQAKKAISWFMPNKHMPWDVRSSSGNPSKSVPVNDTINKIRKMECRKQGRQSQAKRDIKRAEYRLTMRLLEAREGQFDMQSKVPAMMKFQFHIIARTDDITNLETNDLRSHNKFGEFALQTKVSWSKNVMEERACPDQLLIGAADTDFCILLALACYLESRLENSERKYLFGERDDEFEPDRINERYCRVLRECWKKPEFLEVLSKVQGSLGSHSNRKFPATWCAENGCSDAEVEIRGRWKGKKNGKVVNRYISVEQLTTDAKLAGVLAVGGPIRYRLKEDSHVSPQFLESIVVPRISEHFGSDPSNNAAQVLALPLLWACHEPTLAHMMSPAIQLRVQQGYNSIRGEHDNTFNPVEKVPLHISRIENQVFIQDAIVLADGDVPMNGGTQTSMASAQSNQLQTILLSINRLDQRQAENHQHLQSNISELRNYTATQFKIVNTNITRYSMQPVRRIGPSRPGSSGGIRHTLNTGYDSTAKLAPHPRTLLLLWHEYLYGLSGNKPAKNFTSVERGKVKYKYCRRKCFWDVMVRLVNAGFTEISAIDKIHQAYGVSLSVTAILAKLQRDKKDGGHPNLSL